MDSSKVENSDYSESDDEALINIKKSIVATETTIKKINTNSDTNARKSNRINSKKKNEKRKKVTEDGLTEAERDVQEAEVAKLRNILRKVENKFNVLEKEIETVYDKYRNIFNPDQIAFISNKTCSTWKYQTITKSFKLFAACGPRGYAEIKRQCLPYPSVGTLKIVVDNIED